MQDELLQFRLQKFGDWLNYPKASMPMEQNSSEDEVADDGEKKIIEVPRKENEVQDPAKKGDKNDQEKDLIDQEEEEKEHKDMSLKDANGNRIFTPVSADGSTYVNLGGSIPVNAATLSNADLPTDPLMPDLEDTGDLHGTGIFG
nr:hypothetical protein [Tanacetum cinerariifolium]